MRIERRKTIGLQIGSVKVGDGAAISIQSMTKTDTRDVSATLAQIEQLAEAGCDIIRVAVPDMAAAEALKQILPGAPIPVIADVHFDYQLALDMLKAGIDGLRLNPGNIRQRTKVQEIAARALEAKTPIRVGVNAGSLPQKFRKQVENGHISVAQAMVNCAKEQIKILEDCDFQLIKVSLKSSEVLTTIEAYRLMANECNYPFHCGITEAGPAKEGIIKSTAGLAILISEGLADTIRLSLTAPPLEEVYVGKRLLEALGQRKRVEPEIVSCPTCGRLEIDLQQIIEEVDTELRDIKVPLKIAIMGCIVNGPGEARDADIGLAGGKGKGVIFKKGRVVCQLPEKQLARALLTEIKKLCS